MAPPFDARAAGDNQAMVVIGHGDRIHHLPIPAVRMLGLCNRYRSLQAHTRYIADSLRLPAHEEATVYQTLENLLGRGLLLDQAALLRMLGAGGRPEADGAATIETLFVRSCGRPQTLERLFESLLSHDDTGGLKRCVVLDDDPDPERSAQTAAVVQRYRRRLPVALQLVPRTDRVNLVQAIARQAEVDPDHLRWQIEGDADDDQPGYGSSLNLALLLGAGNTMAIMDDDATLWAFRLAEAGATPRLRPVPAVRVVFPDTGADPTGQFSAVADWPLKLHADVLGHGLAGLAESHRGDADTLLADLDPQLLFSLSPPTRVRITSNGTLGDPGTSSIHWMFTEPPETLQPLCQDGQQGRERFYSRRVARCVGELQIAASFSLMTTTLTGVDNRELLLPTQARGPNEDLLFGVLVDYLHPGSLHASLPHMLYHMRPEPRQWRPQDLDRPRNTNRGRFLAGCIERLGKQAPGADAASRLGMLREWMAGLAAEPQAELAWRLHRDLLELRSAALEKILATRRTLNPPDWLAADFDRSIATHTRVDDADRAAIEQLTRHLPRFASRYAAGLDHWSRAWRYCSQTGVDALLEGADREART